MQNVSSSNSKKPLVPKLRFPEFTDEWKTKLIGEILKINHGKDYKNESSKNGEYPVLGTGGIITYIDSYLCDWDCVCIGRKGTINKPLFMSNPFWSVDTLFYTKPKQKENPKFQYYLFQQINWMKYNEASGVPSLSATTIENIKINLPLYNEQSKISVFLSLIDKKIELQQQLIENLKLYKRGLLLHFFNGKMSNYKLDDLLIKGKAGGTPKSTNKAFYDGDIPFLSISDMTNQGKYICKTEKNISDEGLNNSTTWLVPENSLIISMYASYGLVSINKIPLCTSQAMFSMIPINQNSINYLYYYLSFLSETGYYDKIVSTGTQPNLNADKVKNIPVWVPDDSALEHISNTLEQFDNYILCQNKFLKQLEYNRLALLQQMFI